jgi:hypothetical protein
MISAFLVIDVSLMLALVGWARFVHMKRLYSEQFGFAEEYLNKFRACYAGADDDACEWLMRKMARMEKELGSGGYIQYTAPYTREVNYRFPILNVIAMIPRGEVQPVLAQTFETIFLRHLGEIEDDGRQVLRNLGNPLAWLLEGIRTFLLGPLLISVWLGFGSEVQVQRKGQALFAKAFSSLVTLLTTVMGVVTGWKPFIDAWNAWFNK